MDTPNSNLLKVMLTTLLCLIAMPSWSKPTGDAQLNGQHQSHQPSESIRLAHTAKTWGLTQQEYQQYLKELNNSPSRHWWGHLDPPQVLGMNATTDSERMKYARIDVQLDQERTSKELAFQHAYNKAFKETYPNAQLINIHTHLVHTTSVVQSDDQLYLFTLIDKPEGGVIASTVIRALSKTSNVTLNIFFVGSASSVDIQNWARALRIPKSMKKGDHVTLNHNQQHGSNMLQQALHGKHTPLPVIVRVRQGKSEIIPFTLFQKEPQ